MSAAQPLTQGFSAFLRRRRATRHFERVPLLSALTPSAGASAQAAAGVVAGPAALLLSVADVTVEEALARLQSSPAGLEPAEAARRLARDGPNEVRHEPPLPSWLRLWHCYANPFNLLLTALAGLSLLSSDARSTVVIGGMVALSTGIRFVQEGRAHLAAEALRALVTNTAAVIRRAGATSPSNEPASSQEMPVLDLVCGDLVALSAGDMIPADCRVIAARDLFIAQAAMTGESLPVEKFPGPAPISSAATTTPADPGLLDRRNLLFMGTNVVSGTATALVVATGTRSYFGTLARHATQAGTEPNAFQAGVNSVSWLLIRFAAAMVPVVFVVNGLTKGDWLEAFLFALSVAVGLTPEMLPVIVTTTLAKGAVALSHRQVVVKRLDAIQNFGAMDVLCTDKTGTLTQDRIALARHADVEGHDTDEVLNAAYVNSFHQTGLRNLLDRAVLDHVELAAELKLQARYRKVDELPFDFARRRMSVVVAVLDAGQDVRHELICKGAVDEVLAICTHARVQGPVGGVSRVGAPDGAPAALAVALDGALLARTQAVTRSLAAEGLRVVAVASRVLPPGRSTCTVADEAGLTLIGYIAFLDPPKESAGPALKQLAGHGVRVKVLTGDNELVTLHVCRQVGIAHDRVLSGAQVEAMGDGELQVASDAHDVFVRLTPLHKERVVRALRAAGHVVGFLGDGINDAPALHAADIGISVDSAVDIAKEAADIILLEKSLQVLDDGVLQGRTTFCNLLKYIRMTASSNFGNVLSVLVASAFLPFLPMLPIQLLVQNLLYDLAQTGIPFDRVDAEAVMEPVRWNPSDIGRFMLFFGPVSSLFDLITFAVMAWVFKADTLAEQGLFQSGWFVVGLLTQTLVVHLIRTARWPFVQSRASPVLVGTTLAIMAVGLWLPAGPLGSYFGLQALPTAYYAWLAAIVLSYAVMVSLMKRVYIRRHGWQ